LIDDLKKENEDLKAQLKDNVNVSKLDSNATQQFEKNPLDDKLKEMEAGIKVLQDKIASRDKEVARLKEDLENATRQTEAAVQRALANA
jgi:predicted nuclease with TOPRIM domain